MISSLISDKSLHKKFSQFNYLPNLHNTKPSPNSSHLDELYLRFFKSTLTNN